MPLRVHGFVMRREGKTMSWRDVFDCKVSYLYRDHAAVKARECGYKFLAWNGDVMFILDDRGACAETGIKVAALLRFHESA